MQTIEKSYTVKNICKKIGNGDVIFNHPMQRKPGQWDIDQQSLLVNSLLASFICNATNICNADYRRRF